MQNKFVQVVCDIDCEWDQNSPRYRAYVNNELFTERTWIWKNEYLEECLQIFAPPGYYSIRYELVAPSLANLHIRNVRVVEGPGQIVENNCLLIRNENT